MTRYHITGSAVQTTVSGAISASGSATIVITDASGWPDASVGPYAVVIDPGESNEEAVLVTARVGLSLTVTAGNRGWDGTSSAAHFDGAVIYPCVAATYVDEANAHQENGAVHLGTGTIQSTHFAAGSVETAALATAAVTDAKLASNAVTEAKIASNAVTTSKIVDSTITTAKIADTQVTAAKLASDAVTTVKIADAQVTTAKLVDLNVTGAKLALTDADIARKAKLIGEPFEYPVGDVPSWAVELNGQAISRTTYASLFTLWGTTYGVGDGSTTFNVENRKGKVPVGQDTADSSFNTIGETGGAKTHALSLPELASHAHTDGTLAAASGGPTTHTIDGASMTNIMPISPGTVQSHRIPASGSTSDGAYVTFTDVDPHSAHIHDVTGSTASTGSGTAHNNLQPYTVSRWLVRAL